MSTWNKIGNVQGPAGPAGATGATGATGAASSVPGPTGPTGPTGVPGPMAFGIDFSQGAVVVNGVITVVRKAPFALTITSMDYEVGSAAGSFTVAVKINATSVTGLSAVAVSSATTANTTATAANVVAAGDKISVTISAVSGAPTGANLQINGTR